MSVLLKKLYQFSVSFDIITNDDSAFQASQQFKEEMYTAVEIQKFVQEKGREALYINCIITVTFGK